LLWSTENDPCQRLEASVVPNVIQEHPGVEKGSIRLSRQPGEFVLEACYVYESLRTCPTAVA
jgi:hypothetical protein